jgi:hypothetical protein
MICPEKGGLMHRILIFALIVFSALTFSASAQQKEKVEAQRVELRQQFADAYKKGFAVANELAKRKYPNSLWSDFLSHNKEFADLQNGNKSDKEILKTDSKELANQLFGTYVDCLMLASKLVRKDDPDPRYHQFIREEAEKVIAHDQETKQEQH